MDGKFSIVCKFSLKRLQEVCLVGSDIEEILVNKSPCFEDKQNLLDKLSHLMLDVSMALCIARQFRGILLEILKRTQSFIEACIDMKILNHQRFSLTLSHLLQTYPYIMPFVLKYFRKNGPFFYKKIVIEHSEIAVVVEAAYRFLSLSPSTFRTLWNWGDFCELVNVLTDDFKEMFMKTLTILFGCNNKELIQLFGNDDELNYSGISLISDRERLERDTNKFISSSDSLNLDEREIVFLENDLCEDYIIVAGNVLVPKISKSISSGEDLVTVSSMLKNIEALSIAIVSGKPILISGDVGCGKTSLVEYVAALTGRSRPPHLFKIQLGDQTDSKALIGSYCCSDIPGEFIWIPGVLTRAVREGRWLLLEDINCAPMDVVSVLIQLMESRVLSIPGKENVSAAPGFQLFATQRVGRDGRLYNAESSILDHLWSKVELKNLTKEEFVEIAEAKFPSLQPFAEKLVDIFSLLSRDLELMTSPDTRRTNLRNCERLSSARDFMKWCRRLNSLSVAGHVLLSPQDVFQEAMDCFCATVSNPEKRLALALAIGAKVNINKAKVKFFCNMSKPTVNVAPLSFTIGRITLNRKQPEREVKYFNFAFTRHSLALLESIAVCVSQNEPVLLVGETGTGKTSAVQYLAAKCNRSLVVVNMSQQSDSTDLIGGFKPIETRQLVAPVREDFENLFCETFSRKQNVKFLANIQQCFGQRKWEVLFKVMLHTQQAALNKLSKELNGDDNHLLSCWKKIGERITHIRQQIKQCESAQLFSFVEGALVKVIKRGDWVLLDEVNLASPETLECLNGILESQNGSLVVLERGDCEPIERHEGFRMFACMNPANDVGKKDLPAGIRNRFTEIFVNELHDVSDLKTLVHNYLQGLSPPGSLVDDIVSFYLSIREMANEKLSDGSGNRPYYSLRTLCRAMKYASGNPHGNILRSVYEGCCVSFFTQLDRSSHNIVEKLLQHKLLSHVNTRGLLHQPLRKPVGNETFLNFEGYWVCQGSMEPIISSEYVFTSSVKDNLKCLARIVSGRDFPVLIQGETSVGKTSLINWLAKASGNYCVRINNHEHTDIQEYMGCYTSDRNGKLIFKEGILVDAMRKGYWVILDELNLAPTDVLEALNRLLDDNRELFIPELQETIKAHSKFMLFATQNPPGQYGGRKVLSRAFRNRFVELHFEELPSNELETILHKRCHLPLSYSKTLVKIMLELQVRRRGSNVFSGKQGFITLRDLFRWAERYSKSENDESTFFDWNQQLAEDGYFLLAGRCRNPREAEVVKEVIEKHMKRKIDVHSLFGDPFSTKLSSFSDKVLRQLVGQCPKEFNHVVFTQNMRRLAVLVARALEFHEPVLLVGETGCGKTTICQIFAEINGKKLRTINCHMHTETSDFLGGLRPARNHQNDEKEKHLRLFEWCDGSLVKSMKEGNMFLADEISLADDSVLERLNSVLEPERTLILAEKGGNDEEESEQDIDIVHAQPGFELLATMNPGGDYGKKELSPALRNRFTEIWCPSNDDREDLIAIVEHNVASGITLTVHEDGSTGFGKAMVEFVEWFKDKNFGKRCIITVRDFLTWVQFINICCAETAIEHLTTFHPAQAYFHGAFLVFLDALDFGGLVDSQTKNTARDICVQFLMNQLKGISGTTNVFDEHHTSNAELKQKMFNEEVFNFGAFAILKGPEVSSNFCNNYALDAPTVALNAQRVLRAMQLNRPILLEGSPGVGKTSLVSAIAKVSHHRLVRINLSEQTDISDLFGADLPVEGSDGCRFSWCDGPLLLALKSGSWIVLDELNLASQSVLEGLNACFDHRGEIFIPELGKSFQVQHTRTKFFACQNPLNQGGGRKGLPKSFLNRFTRVYIEALTRTDLMFITESLYPNIEQNTLEKMINFNDKVHHEIVVKGLCSKHGGKWEFNLRDLFRWCDLIVEYKSATCWNPEAFVHLIFAGRMRSDECEAKVWEVCDAIFGWSSAKDSAIFFHATPSTIQVGSCVFPKSKSLIENAALHCEPLYVLHRALKPLESLLTCLKMNWLTILVGPKSSGKTALAKLASQLTGNKLVVMAMNSSIDTTELLGGYEQADLERQRTDLSLKVKEEVFRLCRSLLLLKSFDETKADLKRISKMLFNLRDSVFNNNNNDDVLEMQEDQNMLDYVDLMTQLIDEASNVCRKYASIDIDFEHLENAATKLRAQLIKSKGNTHLSGQFEWVDGQLVKALKEGHWLLIDNVNFCSASVLDRLNGLLEPNGELSINERGIVDDEIPVVKPHPNFRLIFTMDPKHGEISRAMRNRGVEIFMPSKLCDASDLCSMLNASGCKHPSTIAVLSRFYYEQEEGTLVQTIHAASLATKLYQRGLERDKSIVMSLMHAVGYTNVDLSLLSNEEMMSPSKGFICLESPSGIDFQKKSVHSMIVWHFNALKRILNDARNTYKENTLAISLFLEWCCVGDWRMRLQWLKCSLPGLMEDNVSTTEVQKAEYFLERLFGSNACKGLLDFFTFMASEFKDICFDDCYQPINLRVNGPMFEQISHKFSSDQQVVTQLYSYTNRVFLLWTLLWLEAKIDSSIKKLHPRSPLALSLAYTNNEISVENLPHEGLQHIFPLIQSCQECLRWLLDNSDVVFDDNFSYKTWIALRNYRKFLDACTECLTSNESCHYLFDMYWRFFSWETVDFISKTFDAHSSQIVDLQKLLTVRKCLDDICHPYNELSSCHWSLMKNFHRPTAFNMKELCDLWAKLTYLYRRCNNWIINHQADGTFGVWMKQFRFWGISLTEHLMALMALRHGRITRENAVDTLSTVKKFIEDVIRHLSEKEKKNPSFADLPSQLAQISIADHENKDSGVSVEFLTSEMIETYRELVSYYAFMECVTLLKLMYVREARTDKSNSKMARMLDCLQQFCVVHCLKIPLHLSLVRLILKNPEIKNMLSICDEAELGYVGDKNTLPLHSSCFTKTFQFLRCNARSEYCLIGNESGFPSLMNVKKKFDEYRYFVSFLWINQNYFPHMKLVHCQAELKSIFIAFVRLLQCFNDQGDFASICTKLLNISCAGRLSNEDKQIIQECVSKIKENISQLEMKLVARGILEKCLSLLGIGLIQMADFKNFNKESNRTYMRQFSVGLCWIQLGMLQSTLLRPVGVLDPVEETNFKVDSMNKEIEDMNTELKIRARNEEMLTGVNISRERDAESTLQVNPSFVKNLVEYQKFLRSQLSSLGEEVAYRPVPSQFRKITGILEHFSNNVANYMEALTTLHAMSSFVLIGENIEKSVDLSRGISYLKTWKKTIQTFTEQLVEFVAYQDILGPYICGLNQILKGTDIVLSTVQNAVKWAKYGKSFKDFKICFPNEMLSLVLPFSFSHRSTSSTVSALLSEKVSLGIEALFKNYSSPFVNNEEYCEMFKCRIWLLVLRILRRKVYLQGYTTTDDIQFLNIIVKYYQTLWLKREEERRLEEVENESLYKFKTQTYCEDESSEVELNQKDIEEIFTRFDDDFKELESAETQELSHGSAKNTNEKKSDIGVLDLTQFCNMHQFILCCSPNVCDVFSTFNNKDYLKVDEERDAFEIVFHRYNISSEVVALSDLSDGDLRDDSSPSHLIMSSMLMRYLSSHEEGAEIKHHFMSSLFEKRGEEYDIYHDSNLKETVKVVPILLRFKTRLEQLLVEWPEHPTLAQLCQTIERILSFSVTSPVMKILNGLEILLKYSQEWECNASRHVSIRINLNEVTQMIIQWRKLELRCWSSLLRVCEVNVSDRANHCWFHLHHVIQEFSRSNEQADCTEFINILQQFIEKSSIGEFCQRLNMLRAFHSQKILDKEDNSDIVVIILWNVYCYYKQFQSQVNDFIQKAKTPIEKELKDFIKIIKWKDINYWAMKETASKSHYTLLKFMKKYRASLSVGIDAILNSTGKVVALEKENQTNDNEMFKLAVDDFLSPKEFKMPNLENEESESQLSSKLFTKMRKLTQRKLNTSRYERSSFSVDKLAGEIVSKALSLQQWEIGKKTGEERTRFIKHVHVMKKRSLADLFKELKKIGLSYRKGINICQQNSLKNPMLVDTSDLSKRLKNMDNIMEDKKYGCFASLWESSMEYYQKCVYRNTAVNNLLSSPSKDLTMGDVDRIKGIAEHLRQITQRQREIISSVGKMFSNLRMTGKQLEKLALEPSCRLPHQIKVSQWTRKLDDLLNRCLETSDEIRIFTEACPDVKIDSSMSPDFHSLSNLAKCSKDDDVYVCLKNAVETFLVEISKIKSNLLKQALVLNQEPARDDGVFIASRDEYEMLKTSFENVKKCNEYLDEFLKYDSSPVGLGKRVHDLRKEISVTYTTFTKWCQIESRDNQRSHNEESSAHYLERVSQIRNRILVTFQKWYKIRDSEKDFETFDDEDFTIEKYFVGKMEDLFEDISCLSIKEITNDINSYVEFFTKASDETDDCPSLKQLICKIMISILPHFSQYVLLVEYHFHQLLICHRVSCKLQSILLAVFVELLTKGFCLPPDLDDGEGEGATSFEDAENCGVGEGEGMKDVSDQIENEEQLHGSAQQDSDEKENESGEQIADEENGIEMSEDFDGETHDVDNDSGDESGESEDKDLDEQMGDIDGADETLDEKLWADSDNEDNEENNGDEKAERGAGTDGIEESELVAKEANQGSSQENRNKLNEKKVEEDKINELAHDEDDQGNLEENFREDASQQQPEEIETSDMALPDDLQLDDLEDDGNDIDDSKEDMATEESAMENDNDEINDENEKDDGIEEMADVKDLEQVSDNEDGDMSKKEEQMQDEIDKNDDIDKNENEDHLEEEWKTDSETKAENVESVEDQDKPDGSSGSCTGKERNEPVDNDVSLADGDSEGTGNSITHKSGMDFADSVTTNNTTQTISNDTSFYRKQINKSRADRSLGSSYEAVYKKPKVLDSSNESSIEEKQNDSSSAEQFEHLRNNEESHDLQVYDAATSEQLDEQESVSYPNENEKGDEAENMQEDWELPPENEDDSGKQNGKYEHEGTSLQSKMSRDDKEKQGKDVEMNEEYVHEVSRKEWTSYESSVFIGSNLTLNDDPVEPLNPEECRKELQELLCRWRELKEGSKQEQAMALETWHKYESLTSTHAQQLCEQLRIVLEPSIANKLRGDYRTGKRLNMRKVIPYIASQYRKDKIWLRRTKKGKREYQILLAIDDSSSMCDNQSKQLAFESLATITNALTRLEAGEIAICSFGETVNLLHPFHEVFSDQSGANILRQLRFEQKKTRIAQLLVSCTNIMTSARFNANTKNPVSQLLLVVSDGRGIFLEGVETVQRSVRQARDSGMFIVFVVLDNATTNKDSILDIKVPIFRQGQLPEIKSYIEQFPFPFYIVLRDISSLPETLSDSLKQWFELVVNM
ncbi:midasin-like isoform X2 [Xenia sp. Carnegie-2017]|uniref:midasin-like isoform X2 n=1 Tax=Xenia sp. Carnegie-2017 TaxID=2897299 RepID=UPI001F03311F|nr:midasin-like isoform X2 [Xenia sp. Carnegie-2017]